MQQYTIFEIGKLIQDNNPDNIILFQYENDAIEGDPDFSFFPRTLMTAEEISNYIAGHFNNGPINAYNKAKSFNEGPTLIPGTEIEDGPGYPEFSKFYNPLVFDDQKMKIELFVYHGSNFILFDCDIYDKVKTLLIEKAQIENLDRQNAE